MRHRGLKTSAWTVGFLLAAGPLFGQEPPKPAAPAPKSDVGKGYVPIVPVAPKPANGAPRTAGTPDRSEGYAPITAPVLDAAPPIPSFPTPAAPAAQAPQYFRAPRPQLSPYLNLFRGGVNGVGISAIDYYNFVRPYETTTPAEVQRPSFVGGPVNRATIISLDPEAPPASDTALRPPGSPGTFGYTGRYFNTYGTIGIGGRPTSGGRTPQSNRR